MSTGNCLCSVCGYRAAEMFCPCTSPETFLCANCVGSHNIKRGGRAHTIWPIELLDGYKIPGYAEHFQTRTELFPQVRIQVLEQVALVDKAIKEFTDAIEKAIWEIMQYGKKTTTELQALRTELSREAETALEEVERTLAEDKPQLTSCLGSVFRALSEDLRPFQLFSYSLNTSSTLAVVTLTSQLHLSQTAVQPQADQVVQNCQLVEVTKTYFRIFDFQRGAWNQSSPLKPNIQADHNSSWVVLEDESIFICGGEGLSTAYVVGLDKCVEQGRMHGVRYWHGLLYSNHSVYAFGGRNPNLLNSCEKYQVQQHSWTPLPPMQAARYYFNPCLFNGSIYLCGRSSALLEAFSPQTDQMLPFQLTMPAGVYSSCCMYVEDNLLVVHLDHNILKFKAGQAEQLVQTSRNSTKEDVEWQNSQPVVNAALRLYYLCHLGSCYSVNMDTGVRGPAIK